MVLVHRRGIGQNVDKAVILLVGARFTRTKTICFVYYSQGRDRWFGQVTPTPTVDDLIGRFSFDTLFLILANAPPAISPIPNTASRIPPDTPSGPGNKQKTSGQKKDT